MTDVEVNEYKHGPPKIIDSLEDLLGLSIEEFRFSHKNQDYCVKLESIRNNHLQTP